MMRAAIYARYSTDLQNAKSIEDQVELCRRYAEREGYRVVAVYDDPAISGASILTRMGLTRLMADAAQQKFDAIVVEDVDRLARDTGDMGYIEKHLTFSDVAIFTVYGGRADALSLSMKAINAQMFRVTNSRQVRRGLSGKVRNGLSAGGLAYGYRADPIEKGVLHIVPEQARIVQRIFEDYLNGASPRQIAYQLNEEREPPPRGARWNASAIYGWQSRGSGILRNRLYVGQIVWNKSRMVMDPNTGKRVSRPNSDEDLQVAEVPHLRIVEQNVFDAVQAIITPRPRSPRETGAMKRPKRLLSGLLKCAACGAGMSVKGKDKTGRQRIQCSAYAESRTCPDPHTYYLDVVENLVLETLRAELQNPERLTTYVKTYNDARKRLAQEMVRRRSGLERRIRELDSELDRMVNFIAKGTGNPDRIRVEMDAKEAELAALKTELMQEPAPFDNVSLHPLALARYRQQLERLREELEEQIASGDRSPTTVMRDLIDHVVVARNPATGKGVSIEINGKLRTLLEENTPKSMVVGAMVAEEGFEPPTQGL
ncbi:MAG: recombinase family protein [Rhizobiaceae bacterium]|nr:recombinase family protein [Rhizobiaceae bacterium]